MITLEQIDGALGLLSQNRTKLADNLGIKPATLNAYFRGDNIISSDKLSQIEQHLIRKGIEFIDDGVRINRNKPIIFKGAQGFKDFYDDIYETISVSPKKVDICLYNAVSDLVGGYLGDFLPPHMERMVASKDKFRFRVILEEGDDAYLGSTYCEYKWYPKDKFDGNHFYVFGDKVGFVSFDGDVTVLMIENKNIAKTQLELFNLAWDTVAYAPNE